MVKVMTDFKFRVWEETIYSNEVALSLCPFVCNIAKVVIHFSGRNATYFGTCYPSLEYPVSSAESWKSRLTLNVLFQNFREAGKTNILCTVWEIAYIYLWYNSYILRTLCAYSNKVQVIGYMSEIHTTIA